VSRPAATALRPVSFRRDRVAWAVFAAVLLASAAGAKAWLHRPVRTDGGAPGPTTRDFKLAILAYDRVGAGQSDGHLPAERLSEHLEALREAGFHPVSLREVRDAYRRGAPLPKRPILLTFDGGHRSTYDAVDPLLRRLGWPAVMFIDPGLQEDRHATYVYWDRLRRMVHSGIWDVATLGESPADAQLIERRLDGYEVVASFSGAAAEGSASTPPLEDGALPLAFENSLFGVNDPSADPRRLFRLRVPREWSGRELVERLAVSLAAPEAAGCGDAAPVPASRWVLATGHLDAREDASTLTGSPRAEAWLAGGEWAQDFVLEVEVKPLRGAFWIVQQAMASREQWRWGGTERTLYLQRLRPGQAVEVISRIDVPPQQGTWHSLRLVKRGDGVWVEWDGVRVGDMPRSVAAGWRGHVGLGAGTSGEAGRVALRDVRFAAIPYRVRGVSASPSRGEIAALLDDAPCLAAISPPGLVQRGAELAVRRTNRRLLAMVAAHGAWEVLPAVELSEELLAGDPDRAAEVAEMARREGWSGVRLVPLEEDAPSPDRWRAGVESWMPVFARRGLRVVADAQPPAGSDR
jgi:hypothetical protein